MLTKFLKEINNIIEKPKVLLLLNIVGIASLFFIFILFKNSYYLADDYCYLIDIKSRGVIGNCIWGYNNWDGRYLTVSGIVQGLMLYYFPIEIITFFWGLCFLSSGYYLAKISLLLLDKKNAIKNKLLFYVAVIIVLWLVSYFLISEVVFWGTGGIYSFTLLLGMFWLYWLICLQEEERNYKRIVFIIFAFFVGNLTPNMTIPLLVIVMYFTIINNKNRYFNILSFLFLVLGFLVIYKAPGNYIRMNSLGVKKLDFNIPQLFENYLELLKIYLSRSKYGIIFLSIIVLPIMVNKKLLKKQLLLPLLMALSSLLPLMFFPNLASDRTALFFIVFLVLFVLLVMLENQSNWVNQFKYLAFIILLGINFIYVIYNNIIGERVKNEISQREAILKESKNKIVILNPIKSSNNSTCYEPVLFPLNENDNLNWIKECQESYFKVKITIKNE